MRDTIPVELEVIDERFRDVGGDHHVERIYAGGRWLEGPAYVPAGRYLVFSDIPNDRVMRWDETTGAVGVLSAGAGYANGRTLDRLGRLVACEHGHRRVTRTEHDGSVSVIADRLADGRRLNSPNDVVEHSDGAIWFTDPSYGIDSDYEGYRAPRETDGCHVYRVDPTDGSVRAVTDDVAMPNGLAFSADERVLYVVDSGRRHLRRFEVVAGASLAGGEVIAECDAGTYDGLRLDAEGRLWLAAHDGVHCLAADGTLLGKLRLPEIASNLTFGGPRGNDMFVTATTSVYAWRANVRGVQRSGPPVAPTTARRGAEAPGA